LILFEPEKAAQPEDVAASTIGEKVIGGEWSLLLEHINGERVQTSIPGLSDLTENTLTKHFAGVATYEKVVTLDSDQYNTIELGEVQGISELFVNDRQVGLRWYGDHRYEVGNYIVKGENRVTIKLTTITGNYLKGLDDNKVARLWTAGQNYYPMGVMGPVIIS